MSNKERYNLPTIDDFFERTHGDYIGRVQKIDADKIINFKYHPFKVKDDAEMDKLVESIKENGVLTEVEYEIEKVGYNKNQVIIKFKNIDTVEEAEKLRNSYIVVDREIFGELPEGVYYIADLIGLEVFTKKFSNQDKVSKSKSLVGSSKNKISGLSSKSFNILILIFSPPDKVLIVWSKTLSSKLIVFKYL